MGNYILKDGVLIHADMYEDYLMHYGVKGMKWGQRRALKYYNKQMGIAKSFASDPEKYGYNKAGARREYNHIKSLDPRKNKNIKSVRDFKNMDRYGTTDRKEIRNEKKYRKFASKNYVKAYNNFANRSETFYNDLRKKNKNLSTSKYNQKAEKLANAEINKELARMYESKYKNRKAGKSTNYYMKMY